MKSESPLPFEPVEHGQEATISDPGAVRREAGEVFDGKIVVGEDLGRYQV